jgi:hypothetical protein
MARVQKSIVLRTLLLMVILISVDIILSLSITHAQPKPTDPSYATWWQHYFQGNVDGMNNRKVPGPHTEAYNKGWKDGYQEIYGVYIPVPQGKSTDYVKGYRIGYSSRKGMAQNGDDVGTDEIPDICHGYSTEWCNGWSDGYKVGWNRVGK